MTEPREWIAPAKLREIEQGITPADYASQEQAEVESAVRRILGSKTAADASEPEAEPEQLSRSEQRRKDRREAERLRRFGRG